jgi:zinc transport system substrate-binding protein
MKRRRWRLLAAGLIVVLTAGTLHGCSAPINPWADAPGSPRVLASFPPLYCFTKNVAGEGVGVLCLNTAEDPHEVKDPPRAEYIKVRKADLFLVNGLELESDKVVNGLKKTAGNPRLEVIRVGEAVPEAQRRHLGGNGPEDPHVWLGIPEAKRMVEKIRDELQRIDPKRKDQYAANAKAYLTKLDDLLAFGKAQLGGAKLKVIAMHDSMGYFAQCFHVDDVATIQANPGEDPSGRKMQELIKLGTQQGVRAVCYEKDAKKDSAETLMAGLKRNGVTAVLVEFDPLETADPQLLNAGWYEERMRSNILNLAQAVK